MLKFGKIEVSSGFLLLLALLIYLDDGGIVPLAVVACIAHELGHYGMIRLLGGRVCCLRLSVVGAEMRMDWRGHFTDAKDFLCTLAGPCTNLLLAMLAACFDTPIWAGINFILGCFHCIPILPLDGGRALKIVIGMLKDEETAARYTEGISRILAVGLMLGGVAQGIVTHGNFTLLIVGTWIFSGFTKQRGLSTPV